MPRQPLAAFLQGHAGGVSTGNQLASDYNDIWKHGMTQTAAANAAQQAWVNNLRLANLQGEFKTAEAQRKANDEINSWGDVNKQPLYVAGRITPKLPESNPADALLPPPNGGAPAEFNAKQVDYPPLPPGGNNAATPPATMAQPSSLPPAGDMSAGVFNKNPLSDAQAQLAEALGGAGRQAGAAGARGPQYPDYSGMSFNEAFRTANARGQRIFRHRPNRQNPSGIFNSRQASDTRPRYENRMNQNDQIWQRTERVMPSDTVAQVAAIQPTVPTFRFPPPKATEIKLR